MCLDLVDSVTWFPVAFLIVHSLVLLSVLRTFLLSSKLVSLLSGLESSLLLFRVFLLLCKVVLFVCCLVSHYSGVASVVSRSLFASIVAHSAVYTLYPSFVINLQLAMSSWHNIMYVQQ